jgi:putative nucleotidyltransferase with HDIG domain
MVKRIIGRGKVFKFFSVFFDYYYDSRKWDLLWLGICQERIMSMPVSLPPLEGIFKAAESLPPFPDVVWKVMPLLKRMAPVHEIEAVIKFDQATTARILALSRSTAFSRRRTSVGSLQDAIVTLGQQQLIQVLMAACAARYYDGEAEGYDLQEGELWRHAVATALLAEMAACSIGLKNSFIAYTAGLLHDIGKNVLSYFVKDYFNAILGLVRNQNIRFIDAERKILGTDHQQLGGMIAQRWCFPPEVITAISFHHHPDKATEHRDVVGVVYAANRMVSAIGVGAGVDGFLQPNHDNVFLELGIDAHKVDKFLVDVVYALDEIEQFFSS